MAIETRIPLLETILDSWRAKMGSDHAAYRNHCYRVIHFCFALHDCDEPAPQKIIIAAAFHDLGIWSDSTVDYLPPSVALAMDYLKRNGLEAWSEEVGLMIDLHHKLMRYQGGPSPLVEVFRKADLIDVSLGMVKFGLPKSTIKSIREQFPNQGFHKKLGQLAGSWFSRHPVSPPPFLKW